MAKSEKMRKAVAQANRKERVRFRDQLKGVKQELSKVVWPTKKEIGPYTAVVIGTCAIFALGFWLIDSGVLLALKEILGNAIN